LAESKLRHNKCKFINFKQFYFSPKIMSKDTKCMNYLYKYIYKYDFQERKNRGQQRIIYLLSAYWNAESKTKFVNNSVKKKRLGLESTFDSWQKPELKNLMLLLRDCLTIFKVGIAIHQSKALFKGYSNFIKGTLYNLQKKIQHQNGLAILDRLHNSRYSSFCCVRVIYRYIVHVCSSLLLYVCYL